MLAFQVLQELRADGLLFGIRGGMLAVEPRESITDEHRRVVLSHRDELVRLIAAEQHPPCPHDVVERAAILEFCEGLPRAEADALALAETGFSTWDALFSAQREDRGLTP